MSKRSHQNSNFPMARPATALCIFFILWLLSRDSKRRISLSALTWIPAVLVFMLASRMPSVWLGESGINESRGAWVDQVYLAATILGSLAILISRGIKWGKIFSDNVPLMAFYAYFLASVAWSNHPSDSFIRLVKDFGATFIVILVIFSDKHPLEALRAIYVRCAIVAFPLSLLFTRYYDIGKSWDKSGNLAYNGVAGQKNSFGQMLMIFMLFVLWDHLESQPPGAKWPWSRMKWDRWVLLLMGGWLLHVSQSKTSLVCTLVGMALICTNRWLKSRALCMAMFFVVLSFPFIMLLTQQAGSVFGPILEALGRDATFTGRANVWKELNLDTVNPLLGAGFWNFWGTGAVADAISKAANMEIINAHDGYLDLYLDGGFLGLTMLLLLLVASAKRIVQAVSLKNVSITLNRFYRLRFAFLIVTIFGNLTESLLARPCAFWFTTVLVLINYQFPQYVTGGKDAVPMARAEVASEAPTAVFWSPSA